MAQGKHRFARGQKFVEEARRAADRLGVELGWRLKTVPGVGHDNSRMAAAGADALFEGSEKRSTQFGRTGWVARWLPHGATAKD